MTFPTIEASGTFTPAPGFWDVVKDIADRQQRAADEDGGMHTVGVEMLVGYEEGQFTVDDLMMEVRT
ncbi:hypothetical protein B5M44_03945 [Shinella sumterensis]|uniref:hypothetical protein n=1 Tax=Shinella sumterensis TaxID=1967501 RepID=UPI00106EF9E3|nr:hypothetical protein [Shinella sumterensis]MCD1264104.1 hypothetical protein [Shinella sumterensis]TFE99366.1 hypothetical protein B5M44_03945 [Shinella sumterensis]